MFSTVIRIDDTFKVEGESILTGYEGWIDGIGFNHEVVLPMTLDKSSNSRTSGRPQLGDLEVTMLLNKAYPKLLEACSDGKNLGKVKIVCLRVNDGKLMETANYELGGTYISSARIVAGTDAAALRGGEPRDLHPMVRVRLNYASITANYTEFDNDGKKKGSVASKTITATAA